VLFLCLVVLCVCLFGMKSVRTVIGFNPIIIAFVWLDASWFQSQGMLIGRVICSVKGNSSCICGGSSYSGLAELLAICYD